MHFTSIFLPRKMRVIYGSKGISSQKLAAVLSIRHAMHSISSIERITLAFLLAISMLAYSGSIFAIGDSGGNTCAGSLVSSRDLQKIAGFGTPEELRTAIEEMAQRSLKLRASERIPLWRRLVFRKSTPATATKLEVDMAVREMINIPTCNSGGARMLDYAAGGGNLPVVEFLLALGADPEAIEDSPNGNYPTSLFFRCIKPYGGQIEISRKLAAYKLLVSKGADVNRLTRRGTGALLNCRDPDAFKLLLTIGAKIEATEYDPLDHWAHEAVVSGHLEELAIVKILSELPKADKSLTRRTEKRVCIECSGTGTDAFCRQLETLVEVRDRRIFETKLFAPSAGWSHERIERCNNLELIRK